MSVNPCPVGGTFKGDNPVKDNERPAIWKWAKDNTDFKDRASTAQAINDHFFGGRAPDEWLNDIIGGRKTPFKAVSTEMWRRAYDRQTVIRHAQELNRVAGTTLFQRIANTGWNTARTLETIGHAIVFPVSHAGDLLYRPSEWKTFFEGVVRTYGKSYSKDSAIARVADMQRDKLFDLSIRGGLEVGPRSQAMGILGDKGSSLTERLGEKPVLRNIIGAAGRAWDMLGVMRFELWKKAMQKHIKDGMTDEQLLDFSKNFAEWANDATGAGKGKIANLGGTTLFGPKLTQSKINRVSEIVNTPADFANWKNLTPGEKAVAWKRLSGFGQYAATRLGFLAVNAGILKYLGSDQKVNVTDPNKGDYLQFKGGGLEGSLPGMGSEIRALSRVLALTYWEYTPDSWKDSLSQKLGKEFNQKPRATGPKAVYDIAKDYASGKLHPSFQRVSELASGRTWDGRPLPFSSDKGTPEKPRLSVGEYLGSIGPIPLQGPVKYFYDKVKATGASASESLQITKGLIVAGFGATGAHVKEEHEPKAKKQSGGIREPKIRP